MAVQMVEEEFVKTHNLACILCYQAFSVLNHTTITCMKTYMGRCKQLPSLLAQIGGLQRACHIAAMISLSNVPNPKQKKEQRQGLPDAKEQLVPESFRSKGKTCSLKSKQGTCLHIHTLKAVGGIHLCSQIKALTLPAQCLSWQFLWLECPLVQL